MSRSGHNSDLHSLLNEAKSSTNSAGGSYYSSRRSVGGGGNKVTVDDASISSFSRSIARVARAVEQKDHDHQSLPSPASARKPTSSSSLHSGRNSRNDYKTGNSPGSSTRSASAASRTRPPPPRQDEDFDDRSSSSATFKLMSLVKELSQTSSPNVRSPPPPPTSRGGLLDDESEDGHPSYLPGQYNKKSSTRMNEPIGTNSGTSSYRSGYNEPTGYVMPRSMNPASHSISNASGAVSSSRRSYGGSIPAGNGSEYDISGDGNSVGQSTWQTEMTPGGSHIHRSVIGSSMASGSHMMGSQAGSMPAVMIGSSHSAPGGS
jgi:hypothetical protein